MGEPDCGYGLDPEELGSLNPPMTGNDLLLFVDKDWIAEAEALDALGDLADLLPGVGARVSRVRPQLADKDVLDVHRVLHCLRNHHLSRQFAQQSPACRRRAQTCLNTRAPPWRRSYMRHERFFLTSGALPELVSLNPDRCVEHTSSLFPY